MINLSTKNFAYIRVSSKDQNLARQRKEISDLKVVHERDVFVDKLSGRNYERPDYQSLKRQLRKGDVLYIKAIDRFGRNSREIKREWQEITQDIGADIVVLDMPLLDTRKHKDLLGTFVADLVLQVLSFVAEKEVENSSKRQKEGIAIAKAEGKHLGRPRLNLNTLSTEQKENLKLYYTDWKEKKISGVEFMKILNLKKSSFYKIIKEYESKNKR